MLTNEQICGAIVDVRENGREPTIEALADQLHVEDLDVLNSRLLQAAKDGVVWMVAAWWNRRGDDRDLTLHFAYYVRRGDPDDDIS